MFYALITMRDGERLVTACVKASLTDWEFTVWTDSPAGQPCGPHHYDTDDLCEIEVRLDRNNIPLLHKKWPLYLIRRDLEAREAP